MAVATWIRNTAMREVPVMCRMAQIAVKGAGVKVTRGQASGPDIVMAELTFISRSI